MADSNIGLSDPGVCSIHSASHGGSMLPASKQIPPGEQGRAELEVPSSPGTWVGEGWGGADGLEFRSGEHTRPLMLNFHV